MYSKKNGGQNGNQYLRQNCKNEMGFYIEKNQIKTSSNTQTKENEIKSKLKRNNHGV